VASGGWTLLSGSRGDRRGIQVVDLELGLEDSLKVCGTWWWEGEGERERGREGVVIEFGAVSCGGIQRVVSV
jgi:hypothetical protein